jgi:hypothetical protein
MSVGLDQQGPKRESRKPPCDVKKVEVLAATGDL